MARVANDQIADLLSAQADPIEVVAGLDAPPLQLSLQVIAGDRAAFDPCGGNRQHQQAKNSQSDDRADAPQAATAADDHGAGARGLRLFRSLPLRH